MTIAQEAVDLARRNQHPPAFLQMSRKTAEAYAKLTGHTTVEDFVAAAWRRNTRIEVVDAEPDA